MIAPLRVVDTAPQAQIESNDDRPLIPEGEYCAVFVRTETASLRMFRGAPKLFITVRLVDPGPMHGVELYRGYRVQTLKSAPGRNGSFRPGRRSEVYISLCRLTGEKLRLDRISVKEILRDRLLRVRVRTIKTDYKGRELPECLWYSVIDEILSRDAL
jgi:hypothetical protein